ncbi:MAG: hypothetical protein ABGX69_00005 [Methylococcales bacterium]
MKKQLIVLFTAMALLLPVGTVSAGNHSDMVSTGVDLVKLPFKAVGGVIGGVVGALTGGAQGVCNTWSSVNDEYAKEPVWLQIPVGIVSIAYAVPVGIYEGAPSEALATAKDYYAWLD